MLINHPNHTSSAVTTPSSTFWPTMPWDSAFIGNDIPGTVQSCHSYPVLLTLKNTGTRKWSSTNGVVLVSSSPDGFTFDPSRYPIPEGVVVRPGGSYTFPVTIHVPCPINNGTYKLSFRLLYTLPNGVEIPFGDVLTDNVYVATPVATVGSSGMKMGVKAFAPATTISVIPTGYTPRHYTATIPKDVVNRSASATVPSTVVGYGPGINRDFVKQYNPVNTRVIWNFNAVTGLLWVSIIPTE
jgi:hypothetical protein